jgi:hypothetical protein
MTEAEWLSSNHEYNMTWFLRHRQPAVSNRKFWLFSLACCRRMSSHFTDPRSRAAVGTVERWIEGEASDAELQAAHKEAWAAEKEVWATMRRTHPEKLARAVAQPDYLELAPSEAVSVAGHVAWIKAMGLPRRLQRRAKREAWRLEAKEQCNLLRDIIGNPFQPVVFEESWARPNVRALARVIYSEQQFQRLPELGRLLQAAKCENERILSHCSAPSNHVRGCWVVDLLLGKSDP